MQVVGCSWRWKIRVQRQCLAECAWWWWLTLKTDGILEGGGSCRKGRAGLSAGAAHSQRLGEERESEQGPQTEQGLQPQDRGQGPVPRACCAESVRSVSSLLTLAAGPGNLDTVTCSLLTLGCARTQD